jgi:hypothetical protein
MDPQTIIARRIARELSPGMLVNLGIGIPTLVANYLPDGIHVFFQSENGLIGTGAPPEEGMAHHAFTETNPFTPLAKAAEQVRQHRELAAADNPFLGLQEAISNQIINSLDVFRDARDATAEKLFLAIYGNS